MSEPKRYRLDPESYLAEHPQGDFVDYQDYARLKAEVERLRKLFADTERLMLLDGEYEAAKVGTYARLKAEVERLRKAGDAMASALILFEMKSEEERQGRIKAWSAAKEGNQP